MKWRWLLCLLLSGALSGASIAANTTPQILLQQMKQASRTLNYDMVFINITSQAGVESMRYRHALINHQPVAELLQMDGPHWKAVQQGEEISYFEPGLEAFTLAGNYIVDSLPSLVYADFQQLAPYYTFTSMGRTRIADNLCDVVRVMSRDGSRYSYIVWLDSKTSLPLRVDLLDRDGETLEQFRVITYNVNQQPDAVMYQLQNTSLPPLLMPPSVKKQQFNWQPGWLPAGFKEISSSRRQIHGIDIPVESRLYSDGLFSFSLNISRAGNTSVNQLLRTGRRTVSSQINNNMEITVVGELPPATARRIASSIKFNGAD